MKKIEKWEDLKSLKSERGLNLRVESTTLCGLFSCMIYNGKDAYIPLGVYDKKYFGGLITQLYEFGFDVEYEEPFNLVNFLKESIEPKEFEYGKNNYTFYTNESGVIEMSCNREYKSLYCQSFQIKEGYTVNKIESTLLDNEVKEAQLTTALKELGWL